MGSLNSAVKQSCYLEITIQLLLELKCDFKMVSGI